MQLSRDSRFEAIFNAFKDHNTVDDDASLGDSSRGVVLTILAKLLQNRHGDMSVIFQEMQRFVANLDLQDRVGPLALLCAVCEAVGEDCGESVGQRVTADCVEARSFLREKVDGCIEDTMRNKVGSHKGCCGSPVSSWLSSWDDVSRQSLQ